MSTFQWYNRKLTDVSTLTSFGLLKGLRYYDGKDREILSSLFEKKINNGQNLRPLIFYIGFCLARGKLVPISDLSATEQLMESPP